MIRTILSALAGAAMLSNTAMAAPAGLSGLGLDRQHGPQPLMHLAKSPEVRHSAKVVGPDKSKIKAKAASKVAKVICEGGQVKTTASGFTGCSCGVNVRRITIAKNHYRCDRPQVRNSTKVVGPDHSKVRAKRASEVNGKASGKKAASTGKPVTKPSNAGNTGKPVPKCKSTLTATRHGAATRGYGLATAIAAWESGAKKTYGFHMGKWKHAQNKHSSCSKGVVLWKCTVSAHPCPPA